MQGDPIPDQDHVVRLCKGNHLPPTWQGQSLVSHEAFALREGEPSLSVTWLEYYAGDTDVRLAAIREMTAKTMNVRPVMRLAVCQVKAIKDAGGEVNADITVEHAPLEGNPGHALIGGYPLEEIDQFLTLVSMQIASMVAAKL